MNETELSAIALAEWPEEIRPRILEDIATSDGSASIYGWHQHLTAHIAGIWPLLAMKQRLVAYMMACELSSRVD